MDIGDRPWGRMSILAAAYLAGAVPFSQIAALRRGVDLRTQDNGTVSGTALYRVAGFVPLAVTGSLDVAKGALGPAIATSARPALAATAAATGVAGHNWSVFLRGAGGRGISPALGALGVGAPAGTAVLFSGLIAGRLTRQTGLGCFLAYLALIPVTRRVHGRAGSWLSAAILVPLLAKRVAGNSRPASWSVRTVLYRILLDRDPPRPSERTRLRRLAA